MPTFQLAALALQDCVQSMDAQMSRPRKVEALSDEERAAAGEVAALCAQLLNGLQQFRGIDDFDLAGEHAGRKARRLVEHVMQTAAGRRALGGEQ